ncbi:uncharacterized protein LOC127780288 [Oryza glaberrima]|uniref:uncharacterized protein LOC127780288 n=1 Tax=Oryza glaberrima TaxID=4538 RepID=UPI00224BF589|nr:uncharacterized protein LOC127780288 [Oryza glaberrima]
MLRRSLVAHAVLLFAAVALPLAAAQPWPVCGSSAGTYTAGSTYETNLLDLISALQGNASSPTLFASGALGSAPDTVYGLLLCRGDMSPSDCFDCGTNVWRDAGPTCNRTKDAILVYNQCYAQFSDRGDFLAATNNSGGVSRLISGTNISSTDVAGYDRAVTELLNATVRYAVENSTRLFATGQRVGNDTGFSNIYSMAQCSPDLSPAQCRSCLDGLVGQWWKTFPLNGQGARVAGPRCYLRSELGPFYTGSPMVRLPVKADGLTPASAPAPDVVPAITGGKNNSGSKILVIILPIVSVAIIIAVISLCIWNARKKRRLAKAERHPGTDTTEDFESVKSTLLSLASLQVATDNFHESNKIGEGGFGAVYKGILHGQEVAVKRMAKGSNQGLEELKNELVLVAKLHHRNLVRLVGFCLDEGERLLIYEYMSNKSLDTFLFDAEQKRKLDWAVRFKIIEGIARGLQYLHQDSQKKIVHRDMKASNILLDADMNPKIGDFGLARLFGQDQTREVTSRIAGTFGYMPPEYVLRGQYSTKSDVFSFGILVIEIVTGRRRNSGPYLSEQNDEDILSIVWRHWEEGAIAEMIDHSLGRNYSETEVLKCVNIGLLCVQQNPVDRPTMADVMILLNSDTTCTMPALAPRPAYLIDGTSGYSQTITQWSGRPAVGDHILASCHVLLLLSVLVLPDADHTGRAVPLAEDCKFGIAMQSPTIEQACSDGAMRRRSSVLHAVLLLLVVAAVALPLAAAQPWPVCGTSGGNYTAGSTYESNLLRLASTLRANASASPTLFASGVRGAGPDAVYGLLLCRGDMSPSDCFDCGTRVGDDVAQVCNRTKDAILVYNQCYAQFSDSGDFLAATNNSGAYSLLISGTNISSADVAGYDRAVTELLNATVRYAVENSTRLFATGQRVGADPGFRNIYSMAQCSPDLSPAQCRSCLDGLVGQWWTGFLFPRNGEGARVAGPRCYLRSELGSGFYTGAPMVLLRADGLSPASAPAPDVVPATTLVKKNSASKILVIVLPIVAVAIVAAISVCMWTVRKKSRATKAEHLSELDASEDLESVKSTLLTLGSLQVATDNFDESKKLGEGGFGAVYKGLLFGQEVAVKRMAKGSNQGLEELKNELVLVAKLHHKNLVRLVGFCLEDGERLLVYEYMPNKSLDTFLFVVEQRRQLDWTTRFRIIEGVARGLQYLHQDSQKKIVHRDMKASNVLLDADLNPKIGDFGLARLFGQDQTRDVTNRIVGTFGYMAPEYVIRGQYSTKSDVFSFGILVLEIVTGQRNSGPCFAEQDEDLVSVVWRHWTEGNIVEMIDYSLDRNYPEAEVQKCVNIGLLCVQQNPVDRPTMADVMILLNSDATSSLPAPMAHRPIYLSDGSSGYSQTVTQLSPR